MADSLVVVKVLVVPLVIAGLLASACSASSIEPVDSAKSSTPTVVFTTATSALEKPAGEPTPPTSASTSIPQQDQEPTVPLGVIQFIEILDELLADTAFAGTMIEDPEVFVATGMLLCERLTAGAEPVELLSDYIGSLFDGDPADAPDELLDLSGWLLGTSVGYLCPQHTDLLEAMNQ